MPLKQRRDERARRLCLQQLLSELEGLTVEQVWLESRRAKQDRRDLEAVGGFRAQRIISSALRVDHKPGKTQTAERLLSLPDIVAGATRAEIAGEPRYLKIIERWIDRHTIDLSDRT